MHYKGREAAGVKLKSKRRCSLPDSCQRWNLLKTGREKRTYDQSGKPPSYEALHRLLGAEHDQGRGADEEAGHVGHDVVDGDDRHREDVPHHAVPEGQVQEVARTDKIEHGKVCQSLGGKLYYQQTHFSGDFTEKAVSSKALGGVAD